MERYHILQVFGGQEQAAASWLYKHAQAETYYPLVRRIIKPRTKKGAEIEVDAPLFSGYLFVKSIVDFDWYSLSRCPFVYGYLTNNDEPAPVSSRVIAELRERVEAGEFDQEDVQEVPHNFELHEAVIINPGDVTMIGTIVAILSRTLKVEVHGKRTFVVPTRDCMPAKILVNSQK